MSDTLTTANDERRAFDEVGVGRRREMVDALQRVVEQRRASAAALRAQRWANVRHVDDLHPAQEALRATLRATLGWPLLEPTVAHAPAWLQRGTPRRDELGIVESIRIDHPTGLRGGGLLFTPAVTSATELPIVVALHGGHGSPELAAGIGTDGSSANYLNMVRSLRRAGVAVYVPQLFVWHHGQQPHIDQFALDKHLRHLGGSRAAVDLLLIRSALDAILSFDGRFNASRLGITGLSYGGFYALFSAALDVRYRAVVSSCYVNDRHRYDWDDWAWFDAANRFDDADVARLICPRPLWLEAGRRDEIFAIDGFTRAASPVLDCYRALGAGHQVVVRAHDGGHEYDPSGDASTFLLGQLGVPPRDRRFRPYV